MFDKVEYAYRLIISSSHHAFFEKLYNVKNTSAFFYLLLVRFLLIAFCIMRMLAQICRNLEHSHLVKSFSLWRPRLFFYIPKEILLHFRKVTYGLKIVKCASEMYLMTNKLLALM